MNEENLSIILLNEVIKLWRQQNSDTEIGSDIHKIEILDAARRTLQHRRGELCPEVLDLYEKVYLRDVWK